METVFTNVKNAMCALKKAGHTSHHRCIGYWDDCSILKYTLQKSENSIK